MIRTASLLAICLALPACGTIYTAMYSPQRGYYEKPPEKAGASAEDLLGAPQVESPQSVLLPAPGALNTVTDPAPLGTEPAPDLGGAGAIPGL